MEIWSSACLGGSGAELPDTSEFMEICVEKLMEAINILKNFINSESVFIYHANFNKINKVALLF